MVDPVSVGTGEQTDDSMIEFLERKKTTAKSQKLLTKIVSSTPPSQKFADALSSRRTMTATSKRYHKKTSSDFRKLVMAVNSIIID